MAKVNMEMLEAAEAVEAAESGANGSGGEIDDAGAMEVIDVEVNKADSSADEGRELTLAELISAADAYNTQEGQDAQDELERLAIEAGYTAEEVEDAESWGEVGRMIENPRQNDGAGDEEDQPDAEPAQSTAPELAGASAPPPSDASRSTSPDPAKTAHQQYVEGATAHYVECSIARANLEVKLKEAKKAEKEALEVVGQLIDRGPEHLPLFDGVESGSQEQQKGGVKAADDSDNDNVNVNTESDIDDSTANWRDKPIDDIGLRPVLTEKLIEGGIKTIGQLEDLRAQGSGKFVGLQTIKGIGEGKADEIEEAVIKWLSKNRDAAVLKAARGGQ